MEKIVISHIRLFAIGDQWGAVAEMEDGSEVPIWAVNGNDPSEVPPWEKDEKQYEEWYNRALDAAHEQGMFLEGEMDSKPETDSGLHDHT
jgi:hypothetical protein